MTGFTGFIGFFHDFPEESHETPQVKYTALSFSKNLTGQAIRRWRKEDSTLYCSCTDRMKVYKMNYMNSLFPLKADLFSWFLSETWKLNIILKILLILSEIKIL